MSILDLINGILAKGAKALPKLDSFLSGIATNYPDTAPEINEYLEKARAAVTAEMLAGTGKAIFDEIVHFKGIDPRSHPSDLAG